MSKKRKGSTEKSLISLLNNVYGGENAVLWGAMGNITEPKVVQYDANMCHYDAKFVQDDANVVQCDAKFVPNETTEFADF